MRDIKRPGMLALVLIEALLALWNLWFVVNGGHMLNLAVFVLCAAAAVWFWHSRQRLIRLDEERDEAHAGLMALLVRERPR